MFARTPSGAMAAAVAIIIATTVSGAQAVDFSEGFDEGLDPQRWQISRVDAQGAPWTIEAPDAQTALRIAKTQDQDRVTANEFLYAGIESRFHFDGDYSVSVGFRLHSLPLSSPHGWNEAILVVRNERGINCFRWTNAAAGRAGGWDETRNVFVGNVADSTVLGRLLLTRNGSTVRTWIDRGSGPVPLGITSGEHVLGPVTVALMAQQECDLAFANPCRPTTAIDIAFDDLSVVADRFFVPSDLDLDGDVDLTDFGVFQGCFNGPNRPTLNLPPCDQSDLDGDNDVDLADFSIFQSCFNGPNRAPADACALP